MRQPGWRPPGRPRKYPVTSMDDTPEMAADIAARMTEPLPSETPDEDPTLMPAPTVGVLPSDAERVEDVIDRAVKHMLRQGMDAKDWPKAIEAATKWVSVKMKITEDDEWGTKLNKGTASG